MLTIFIRTLVTFATVFIVIRLMGKRQIGEMQPFELVITLIIADLACIPMADVSTPLVYGIVSILCIFLLHRIITYLNKVSTGSRKVFSGQPIIVITPSGIDYENLNGLNMSIADLQEAMRNAGYFYFDEIDYAIFETNGKLSVLEKDENASEGEEKPLPVTIISEGKYVQNGFETLKVDEKYVNQIVRSQKLRDISQIVVLSINED